MLGYPVNILLTKIQILGQQHYEGIETFKMRYQTTYFHIINPLQNFWCIWQGEKLLLYKMDSYSWNKSIFFCLPVTFAKRVSCIICFNLLHNQEDY